MSPLFDEKDLSFFCADGIKIKNSYISVVWDRDGQKFEKGLNIYANGKKLFSCDRMRDFVIDLSEVE